MTYLSATFPAATLLARLPYPRAFLLPDLSARANCGGDPQDAPALYSETRIHDGCAGPAGDFPRGIGSDAGRVILHPLDQYRVDPSWLDGTLGEMLANSPKGAF